MRLWEIDFFRGVAVVLMVIFNYSFALAYFHVYTVNMGWLFWTLFPHAIGFMFVFISGVSFSVSYSKVKKKDSARKKYISRGGKIFGLGMLITAFTVLFAPQNPVYFGVLHLIGLSIIIAPFFVKFGGRNAYLALILIVLGIYLRTEGPSYAPLVWLGLESGLRMIDYFPVLPWMGVFLFGVWLGCESYPKGKRAFRLRKERDYEKSLARVGRHSLLIYLLHQPVLIAVLYLLGYSLI